jgi:quercetin dioxygenase-like cupin family protein
VHSVTFNYGAMNLQVPMRKRIDALQAELVKMPQIELETTNEFYGGMLCRKVICPEGSTIVGKIHKKDHFFIVLSGTMRLTGADDVCEVAGPHIVQVPGNSKKAAYAVTDCVCVTFHRSDSVDVESAEEELIEPEPLLLFDSFNKLKREVLS